MNTGWGLTILAISILAAAVLLGYQIKNRSLVVQQQQTPTPTNPDLAITMVQMMKDWSESMQYGPPRLRTSLNQTGEKETGLIGSEKSTPWLGPQPPSDEMMEVMRRETEEDYRLLLDKQRRELLGNMNQALTLAKEKGFDQESLTNTLDDPLTMDLSGLLPQPPFAES